MREVIEPPGFSTWNRALRGAYRRGFQAGHSGCSSHTCPYSDKRTTGGRLTWSRGFQTAWCDGWRAGNEQRMQDIITDFYKNAGKVERAPSRWIR